MIATFSSVIRALYLNLNVQYGCDFKCSFEIVDLGFVSTDETLESFTCFLHSLEAAGTVYGMSKISNEVTWLISYLTCALKALEQLWWNSVLFVNSH